MLLDDFDLAKYVCSVKKRKFLLFVIKGGHGFTIKQMILIEH